MARPLPKMNAPALRKNQPNASSVPPVAAAASVLPARILPARDLPASVLAAMGPGPGITAGAHEPQRHDRLRREWAGHGLAQRAPVEEVFAGKPPTPVDQVALHVPDRGDRAAEPPCTEPEEVAHEPAPRHGAQVQGRCSDG